MADPDDEKAGPQVVPDKPGDRSPSPSSDQDSDDSSDDHEGSSEEVPSK